MRRIALATVLLSGAVLTQVAGAGQLVNPHVVLFVDGNGSVATVRASARQQQFPVREAHSPQRGRPTGR